MGYGKLYAQHFSDMVTGSDVMAPGAFPFDITANGLPNLWACAGWVPMYAWDSERNKKNFIKTRGAYAYAEEFNNFAIRENNPLLMTIEENEVYRQVEFDGSDPANDAFWVPTSTKKDDLIYFHSNTIHAFHIKGEDCHAKPAEKAIVTVWARSMAHDRRNDYGTTLLCESAAVPDTPAIKDEKWRCDLTHTKWRKRRSAGDTTPVELDGFNAPMV